MRQLAVGDAVSPIAEIFERRAAEVPGERVDHQRRGLARHDAATPRLFTRLEFTEGRRDGARGQLSELVTADARPVLQDGEPFALRDLVGDRPVFLPEFAGVRDLQHRVPVDRRIVFRRLRVVRRRHRAQIELLARLAVDLGRIDEAVAAHPHLVFGLGKIRHHVAALVVGDHHLGVAGGKVGGLRDHPHPGLRPVRSGHHAADVVVVDGDGGLGAQPGRRGRQDGRQADRRHAQIQSGFESHRCAPRVVIIVSAGVDALGSAHARTLGVILHSPCPPAIRLVAPAAERRLPCRRSMRKCEATETRRGGERGTRQRR